MAVLDAAGFPVIFVETVGAGQAEVDVADAADAVVVVTAPGLGDEVQALKAGLLEIADVLVVNKGDRDGRRSRAGRPARRCWRWRHTSAGRASRRGPRRDCCAPWPRPGEGVAAVAAALERLRAAPLLERQARRRRQAARQLMALAGERARAAAWSALGTDASPGPLASLAAAVAARTLDPWTAADTLASSVR